MAIHEVQKTEPNSPRRAYSGPPVGTVASYAKPDLPDPQSQSLSRSYGSNLPTSLTYIILSTRGCLPWRPAADMGTSWCEIAVTYTQIFKVPPNARGPCENCRALRLKPKPILPARGFQGLGGLCRKDNSSQSFGGRLWVISCCHDKSKIRQVTLPGCGIWTTFPFGHDLVSLKSHCEIAKRLIKASPKP